MRSIAVRLLAATWMFSIASSLGACSLPVRVDVDCAWARPIHFSARTKDWLARWSPWPEAVRVDLDKITKHNEKHEAFCR